MNKRLLLSFTLFLLMGLVIASYPVFASDNGFQQAREASNIKIVAFIRLFVSIAAIVLLFYPDSLLSSPMRELRRRTSFTPFKQALSSRLGKDTAFGIDTNILMLFPDEIFGVLRNETVLMSSEVQNELKLLANSLDRAVSANARRAFRAVEAARLNGQQVILLPSADLGTIKEFELKDTTDDRIVAAYLKYDQEKGNTCLIAHDRGIRLTAGTKGLAVLEAAEAASILRAPSKSVGAILLLIGLLAGAAGYNLLVILSLV